MARMDFVLALHTHLPYVLNHGRWPHGSDWLTEAAVDSYLPLLETFRALEFEGTPTPSTMGITPVLANQLASPTFATELELFFDQRLDAARTAPATLVAAGDGVLVPVAEFWRERLTRLRRLFHDVDGDLLGAFRGLAERGRLELMTSAATHGFLPMLGRDESIQLQLEVGRSDFRRLFGLDSNGIWLPECAYRPRGVWHPVASGPPARIRRGIEEHLADYGFGFFFTDAHMARAGAPLDVYGGAAHGWPDGVVNQWTPGDPRNTPYRAYRTNAHDEAAPVGAFVRDPRSSAQVWSRTGGYPGEPWYLEFHKTRWPGGLKFWRVSERGSDLGAKASYEPQRAYAQAVEHGRHFARLLAEVAERQQSESGAEGVIVAPFDTELFGHWWFEGPEFLASAWRALRGGDSVRAVTASQHIRDFGLPHGLALAAGSWGKNGDWTMWLGPQTAWTWSEIWRVEDAFWTIAPIAIAHEAARPVLAQAARSMLLLQSSDWQFIITTGEAADYAIKRFNGHRADAHQLIHGLHQALESGEWDSVRQLADTLSRRDDLFPDVLASVQSVLAREASRGAA